MSEKMEIGPVPEPMTRIEVNRYPLPAFAQGSVPASPPKDTFVQMGTSHTKDYILREMSAQAMRTRYLFGAKPEAGNLINGTLISRWLQQIWLDLARRGIATSEYAHDRRHSDLVSRGWPPFLRTVEKPHRIFRKLFNEECEALSVVDTGRLFMEKNGYVKMTPNGRLVYPDITGSLFTDLSTDPGTAPYVDFILPEQPGLIDLRKRFDGHSNVEQQMYLIPGPPRVDDQKMETLQRFREIGRPLTPEMQELAKLVEHFGWRPPDVYIPVEVMGYEAGEPIMPVSAKGGGTVAAQPGGSGPAEAAASQEFNAEALAGEPAPDLLHPAMAAVIGGLFAMAPFMVSALHP